MAFSGENGTGTLLDVATFLFTGNLNEPGPLNEPVTLAVSGPGIRSITFGGDGGAGAANSVFFDNLTFSSVPEPSTALCLLTLGLGLALGRRRQVK